MSNINIPDECVIALNKKVNLTNLNKLIDDLTNPMFQLKYTPRKDVVTSLLRILIKYIPKNELTYYKCASLLYLLGELKIDNNSNIQGDDVFDIIQMLNIIKPYIHDNINDFLKYNLNSTDLSEIVAYYLRQADFNKYLSNSELKIIQTNKCLHSIQIFGILDELTFWNKFIELLRDDNDKYPINIIKQFIEYIGNCQEPCGVLE